MKDAEIFSKIFDGLKAAFGTYRIDRKSQNGKSVGKAQVVKAPRDLDNWEGHLSGKGDAMGIIPINEDNSCVWGCIDIDTYPLDHKELIIKINKEMIIDDRLEDDEPIVRIHEGENTNTTSKINSNGTR